jgi:hypothetical protein
MLPGMIKESKAAIKKGCEYDARRSVSRSSQVSTLGAGDPRDAWLSYVGPPDVSLRHLPGHGQAVAAATRLRECCRTLAPPLTSESVKPESCLSHTHCMPHTSSYTSSPSERMVHAPRIPTVTPGATMTHHNHSATTRRCLGIEPSASD